jgi:RNA polymerase sigma factor FliA
MVAGAYPFHAPYGAPELDGPARERAAQPAASPAQLAAERRADQQLAEKLLWQRYMPARDPLVREDLIVLYLPYAKTVAAGLYRQHVHHDVEFQEYVQWSTLGLIEALDRYDPLRGAQFRTYAHLRMLGAIRNGLAHSSERQEQISLRRRLVNERLDAARRDKALDPAEAAPQQLLSEMAEIGSLMILGFMLDGTGMVQDRDAALPDDCYQSRAFKDEQTRLSTLVAQLTPREQSVIRLHYLQGLTYDYIAQSLGITKGRVAQLHEQALQRLRRLMVPDPASK